jgi:hypothetical protein
MIAKRGLEVFLLGAAIALAGCDHKEDRPANAVSSATVSSAAAKPSAANATPKTALSLVARATAPLLIGGNDKSGVVLVAGMPYPFKDGKLAQDVDLAQSFNGTKWADFAWYGDGETLLVAGKLMVPPSMQDSLISGVDPGLLGQVVIRKRSDKTWVRAADLGQGEKLVGVGRYRKDTWIAAVIMESGKDWRFALVSGEGGGALPSPGAPEHHAQPSASPPSPPDSAAASGGATASAAPAPTPAGAPSEPAPGEGTNNEPSNVCATQILPAAVAGLGTGEFFAVGYDCEPGGKLRMQHWAAGARKASLEELPAPPSKDAPLLLAASAQSTYVGQRGSSYLAKRDSDATWKKVDLPEGGSLDDLQGTAGGAVWLIAGGKVFTLRGAVWNEVFLPPGTKATRVLPSDGDTPWVVAGTQLFGPGGGEVADLVGPTRGTGGVEPLAASSVCTDLYAMLRVGVGEKQKFPDLRTKLAGLEGVTYHRVSWGGTDMLLAKLPNQAAAKDLMKRLEGDKLARLICIKPKSEPAMEL